MFGRAARTWAATLAAQRKKKREERNETEETPEPSRKKFVKAAAGRRRERVEVAKEEKHLRDNVYGGNSAPAV